MDFDDSLSEEIGTKIPQVAANMINGDEGVFTSKLHEKQTVQFPRARHIAVKVFGWKVVWNHYFQKQLDVLCCILSLHHFRKKEWCVMFKPNMLILPKFMKCKFSPTIEIRLKEDQLRMVAYIIREDAEKKDEVFICSWQ
ncbi:hypothetical protein P8452_71957 [Trifolium repens]|nr:hypothetical protein P8452_71957 [Trifolium repens]